jgi:hypothetical protein
MRAAFIHYRWLFCRERQACRASLGRPVGLFLAPGVDGLGAAERNALAREG